MPETTEWKSPGTATNIDRDGGAEWADPNNARLDDSSWSRCDPKNDYGDWLRLTSYGFTSDDIPLGATIDGIEIKVIRKSESSATVSDSAIYLRKTAGQVGDNKASETGWSMSEQTVYYGGAADTWNAGLVQGDIVSADFGIDLSMLNDYGGGARWGDIDVIEIRVTYTEGAAYHHGLKVQGVGELALCDVGTNPLRIRKGGTTYGIELVAIDDPNASAVRIKTGTGIEAIRKYT